MIKSLDLKELNFNLELNGKQRVNSVREVLRSVEPTTIRPRKAFDNKRTTLKKINSALEFGS